MPFHGREFKSVFWLLFCDVSHKRVKEGDNGAAGLSGWARPLGGS